MISRKSGERPMRHIGASAWPWLAAVVAVGIGSPAAAQDMGGAVGFNNVTNAICGGSCDDVQRKKDRIFDGSPINSVVVDGKRQKGSHPSDFTYIQSDDRTRQNLRSFVARTPAEAGRADLAQAIAAQPRMMEDIASGVRTYGIDLQTMTLTQSGFVPRKER